MLLLQKERSYEERMQTMVENGQRKRIPSQVGKRLRAPLEAMHALNNVKSSHGAKQYGESDDSKSSICKAYVYGEEVDALVDTGSSITLISKSLFEKIRKELQRLGKKVTKANYKIQGISGELMEEYSEVKDI